VFPRPLLDAALDQRRAEREEGTREVREQMRQRGQHEDGPPRPHRAQPAASPSPLPPPRPVAVVLRPAPEDTGGGSSQRLRTQRAAESAAARAPPLSRPQLAVPPHLTVATLRLWLVEQLLTQQEAAAAEGEEAQEEAEEEEEERQPEEEDSKGGPQQQQQQQTHRKPRGRKKRRGVGPEASTSSAAPRPPPPPSKQRLTAVQLQRLQLSCCGEPLTSLRESVEGVLKRLWLQRRDAVEGARDSGFMTLNYNI
jgi:hypothetical protein